MAKTHKNIVKRRGHSEPFDERKIYASAYAAALNAHYTEKEAEGLAKEVSAKIVRWVNSREVVTSNDLRHQMILAIPDPAVALLYKHHLDVC